MKYLVLSICLILSAGCMQSYSQETDIAFGLTAFIDEDTGDGAFKNRLYRQIKREFDLIHDSGWIDFIIYEGVRENLQAWKGLFKGEFLAVVDIIDRQWVVDRPFKIPFFLNVYQNNYRLEAFIKLYYKNTDNPVAVKKIDVSVKGPKVFQILENNPHDGGLLLSNSRRILSETEAERKFAERISRDLFELMKSNEG
jgi:hypothetical protein